MKKTTVLLACLFACLLLTGCDLTDVTSSLPYQKSAPLSHVTSGPEEFYYNPEGDLRIYEWDWSQLPSVAEADRLEQSALRQIAEDFTRQHVDMTGYTLVDTTYDDQNKPVLTVEWKRFVGEYRTFDHVSVDVLGNGQVIRFAAPNADLFQGITLPERVDEEALVSRIDQQVKSDYGEVLYTERQELRTVMVMQDNRPAMHVYIAVGPLISEVREKGRQILHQYESYEHGEWTRDYLIPLD